MEIPPNHLGAGGDEPVRERELFCDLNLRRNQCAQRVFQGHFTHTNSALLIGKVVGGID